MLMIGQWLDVWSTAWSLSQACGYMIKRSESWVEMKRDVLVSKNGRDHFQSPRNASPAK